MPLQALYLEEPPLNHFGPVISAQLSLLPNCTFPEPSSRLNHLPCVSILPQAPNLSQNLLKFKITVYSWVGLSPLFQPTISHPEPDT